MEINHLEHAIESLAHAYPELPRLTIAQAQHLIESYLDGQKSPKRKSSIDPRTRSFAQLCTTSFANLFDEWAIDAGSIKIKRDTSHILHLVKEGADPEQIKNMLGYLQWRGPAQGKYDVDVYDLPSLKNKFTQLIKEYGRKRTDYAARLAKSDDRLANELAARRLGIH